MNNKLALAILIVLSILMPNVSAAGDIVISEVLYDPTGTETGGEAVELYNPSSSPVDISGWVLVTESSSTDATIPDGTLVGAQSYYLIADSGWSASRDDPSWPEADHEEAITMSNSDAGVALVALNGTTVDAIGWGDAAGIDPGLFEGVPAVDVSAGNSLVRVDLAGDSDDNSIDFVETSPDPQNSSSSASGADSNSSSSIELGVDVENNPPVIDSFVVLDDEDSIAAGVQVSPVPEGVKTVMLSADVTDIDGTEPSVSAVVTGPNSIDVLMMSKTSDLSNTSSRFNATLDMEFHKSAGEYTINITASDGSGNSSAEDTFEYLSMTAISIDASSLRFEGAKLGGTSTINGDFALSTSDTPTIRNIGNTYIDVGLYGTDFVDGTNVIGAENLKYSFDNDFASVLSGTLSKAMQIQNLGLSNSADSVISLGFQLFVPPSTQNGNYTANITVVAVSS